MNKKINRHVKTAQISTKDSYSYSRFNVLLKTLYVILKTSSILISALDK